VTDPEPLPADDPLWDCPNLILTPHLAGANGPVGRNRLAAFVAGNVARFVSGKPPEHVVEL
jgi:phosphoglycerate dehydrogenase-like enzyme